MIPHVSSSSHGLRSHFFLTCYGWINRYSGFPLEAIINQESLRPRATLPFQGGVSQWPPTFHPALVSLSEFHVMAKFATDNNYAHVCRFKFRPQFNFLACCGQLSTCRLKFTNDQYREIVLYSCSLLWFLWPLFKTRTPSHKTVVLEQPWATSSSDVFLHGRNTGGGALDWICPCLHPQWATTDWSSWKVTRNSHALRKL